jgi:hypothetical protein
MKLIVLGLFVLLSHTSLAEITVNADCGSYGPRPNNLVVQSDHFEGTHTLGYDVMGFFYPILSKIGCDKFQILEGKILVCDDRVIGSVGEYSTDGHEAPTALLTLNENVDAHIFGSCKPGEKPLTFALTRMRTASCDQALNAVTIQ